MSTDPDAANAAFDCATANVDDAPAFALQQNGRHASPPPRINNTIELLDRAPPNDRLAELNVCGGILLNPSLLDGSGIFDTHFLDEQIKTVFDVMRQMMLEAEPVDFEHLIGRLKAADMYEVVGGKVLMSDLIENARAAPSRFGEYADRLKQCASRRSALHTALLVVKAVHSRQPTPELLNEARDQFEILANEGSGADDGRIIYPVITAADLASTQYNVDFFIDGMVPVGQPQGRFGGKKTLKTTIACAEGFSIATGLSYLNYFRVGRTARVGFFSGESGMATIQETMLRIARAFDTDLAEVDMVFSDRLPSIGSKAHMVALEKYIVDNGIEVLYVDPAYLAMLTAGNEGSLFAMGALLQSLSEMCQRLGVTVTLLHHMKKSIIDPYSPGDLDDASWSGFAEFCRSWMLINRREKYVPGSGVHRLWLSVGGSIGHGGLWGLNIDEGQYTGPGSRIWEVEVLKAEDVRDEVAEAVATAKEQKQNEKLEQSKKAFLRALAKHPAGETIKAVREAAGLSGSIANLTLAALIQDQAVIACEVIKPNRKSPYEGYRLNLEGANA